MVSVSGNLNSNGTFSLTGTTSGNVSLSQSSVPVTTLTGGATVTLTQSSLTIQGGLAGGVLAQVSVSGTATGLLTITSNGATTLSGSIIVQPIVSTVFRIESSSGSNMSATGSATLPFGVLSIPLSNLSITSGSGLNFSQYDETVDSGWITFLNVPGTVIGDIRARLLGSVTFKVSGGTSFSSTLSYSWAPWLITQTCNPAPPFGDGVCTTHFPPSNINDVPAPPRFSGSGSISSSGQFTINQNFLTLTSFSFDLW